MGKRRTEKPGPVLLFYECDAVLKWRRDGSRLPFLPDKEAEPDTHNYILRRIETTERILRESDVMSGRSIPNIYMGFWQRHKKLKETGKTNHNGIST